MGIRTAYAHVSKALLNKKHLLFVDLTIFVATGYLMLKKSVGWSVSALLLPVFHKPVVDTVLWGLFAICVYALVVKGVLLFLNTFPATRIRSAESDRLQECCLTINQEIERHLARISSAPTLLNASFVENHSFQRNVGQIADTLARHIIGTLNGASEKDIFVSVYQCPGFEDLTAARASLQYLCHYPARKDAVVSHVVSFASETHSKYECVKCINSPGRTRLLLDTADYYRSNARRHKKIKHYIGMKLRCDQTVLGFVNIEFYNSTFFSSEDEMADFVEDSLLSFIYLLEYQFLKSAFFHRVRPHLV